MQQLLQITTNDVKYELKVQHARLEYNQDFQPQANMKTTKGGFSIESKPTELRLDTYSARNSLGFMHPSDLIANAAQKGKQAWSDYMAKEAQIGEALGRKHEDPTISAIIKQRVLSQTQSQSVTVFIPSTGADISWIPGEISMDYTPDELKMNWDITPPKFDYIPGDVSLEILERPSVDIEYIGTPIYFPRSADPNYEETSAL